MKSSAVEATTPSRSLSCFFVALRRGFLLQAAMVGQISWVEWP